MDGTTCGEHVITLALRIRVHFAAAKQVGMVHLLSMPTDDPLGNYSSDFFIGDPRVSELVTDFRARLDRVSETIHQRNMGIEVPCSYLDPAQIGQSIAI